MYVNEHYLQHAVQQQSQSLSRFPVKLIAVVLISTN